jgi:dinuclear metal center YbgI/SA1388 family protein
MLIKEVVAYLDKSYPQENAIDPDQGRIGLIIGDENLALNKILLSLDLTFNVAKEAVALGANLIITHHPFFQSPLSNLYFKSEKGLILELMLRHKISLFSMHTNLDVGKNGVNDTLADLIGIIKPIKMLEGPAKGNFLRYGNISEISLGTLAQKIKAALRVTGVRIIGNPERIIRSLGVVGGSGAHDEDIEAALKAGIDCYVTGEVKLPAAQAAAFQNLAIIEVNHGVEKLVFYPLRETMIKDLKLDGQVFVSSVNTDPLVSVQ